MFSAIFCILKAFELCNTNEKNSLGLIEFKNDKNFVYLDSRYNICGLPEYANESFSVTKIIISDVWVVFLASRV